MADVTWEHATYFTISGNSVTAGLADTSSVTGNRNGFNVCYVQTAETLVNIGDYFEFTCPNAIDPLGEGTPAYEVGVTWQDNPACDPVPVFYSYCYFIYDPQYSFAAYGEEVDIYGYSASYESLATHVTLTPTTVLKLQKKYSDTIEFFVDGVSVGTVGNGGVDLDPMRLMVRAGYKGSNPSDPQPKVTAAFFAGGGGGVDPCADDWAIPTPAAFPMPSLDAANPLYANFQELAPDWGNFGLTFPDRARQYATIQSTGVRRWEIEYTGLDETQAAILDAHYDSTRGGLSFTLNEPRTSETLTGVRYEDHGRGPHVKKWAQTRTVRLIKTP